MNARRSRPKFPCFDHLTSPPIDSACCLPCESAATLSRGRLPAAPGCRPSRPVAGREAAFVFRFSLKDRSLRDWIRVDGCFQI